MEFSCKCIEVIGEIALKNPSIEINCVRTLIMLLKSQESEKVAAAVISLRKLLCKAFLLRILIIYSVAKVIKQ